MVNCGEVTRFWGGGLSEDSVILVNLLVQIHFDISPQHLLNDKDILRLLVQGMY